MPAPSWTIADGTEVRAGDSVALERHPDEVGRIVGHQPATLLPEILLTGGPREGRIVTVWPVEILCRVAR